MTRRATFALSAAAAALTAATAARATVYDTTWLGGDGGWDDTSKWSLHTVPLNTATDQYNAIIPSAIGTRTGVNKGTVNSVYTGAISYFGVGSYGDFTAVDGFTFDGYVEMHYYANLRVGPNQGFSGSGAINFFYGPCSLTGTPGGSLTIGPGLTVGASPDPSASSGTVGDTAYPLINHGTIASLCTFGSTITVAGQTFANDGTLLIGPRSTIQLNTTIKRLADVGTVSNPGGGGTFRLLGTVDNADSTFVLDGSVPGLRVGGRIVGGAVTATPGNALPADNLFLDNVTLACPVVVSGALKVRDGQALTGNADVLLPSSGTSITSDTPTGTVALAAGVNVHGTGTVGHPTGPLVNHTTVTADVPDQVLTVAGSSFSNDGAFRATNGGILAFGGTYTLDSLGAVTTDSGGALRLAGTLDNTGRTFTNGSPHTWQLAGRILGGTVEAPAGPATELLVPSTTTATLDGVTLNGVVRLSSQSTLAIPKPLAGNATILLGGPSSSVTNVIQPNFTAADLVLGPGVTVRGGSGTLGPSSSYAFLNHGLIQADPGATLTLQGVFGITSDGTLSLAAGSLVKTYFSPLSLGNGGTLSIEFGGPGPQALLNVNGNLNLAGPDTLTLLPLPGAPAGPILIATYTGSLTGTFDNVSPGFQVDYSTPHQIYALAVPEPAALAPAVLAAAPTLLALRRRRRRRRV